MAGGCGSPHAPLASGAPRPAPNDSRGQVSWLPDPHRRPAFPDQSSGVVERGYPVTVAGAARDLSPASLDGLAPAAPASRAIRDVACEINRVCVPVQHWHGAFGTNARRSDPRSIVRTTCRTCVARQIQDRRACRNLPFQGPPVRLIPAGPNPALTRMVDGPVGLTRHSTETIRKNLGLGGGR